MADNKLRYFITGDASSLNRAINTASQRVQGFGNKIKSVGQSLQRLSAVTALAGGAAVKMAMDFDKNITKINALVGTSGQALDDMAEASKRVAKETGLSSADTSNAMFFIASAGLEGAEALQTLEFASKASAAGLGDVATVADLATSAMNAYGSETLNAEHATDILTAAVREGKLNSSELAGAMGQVIPVASALGVGFDEVGAAMAAMSRTGTNAAQGSTQLNAILMGLTKTTPAAEDAFRRMGLNVDELRESLATGDGLLDVLKKLKEGIDGNQKAATEIFPNLRALRGVLDLTGKGADVAADIFGELAKAQGSTAEAFDRTSKSASFKLNKAMNSTKEAFKEVGEIILLRMLPAFENLANFIKNIFIKFQNLDGSVQKLVLAFGSLVVIGPTLITIVGSLVSALSLLVTPVGLIVAGLTAVAFIIYKNWAEVAPVLVGLYNRFVDLFNSSEAFRKVIFGIKAVFKSVFIVVKGVIGTFINGFQTAWKLIKEFSEKGIRGSYLKILKEGFGKGKDIVTEGAEDIGNEFSDSFSEAVGATLEHKTVDQLNSSLSNIGDFVKKKASDLGNFFAGGSTTNRGDGVTSVNALSSTGGRGLEDVDVLTELPEKMKPVTAEVSKLKEMLDATLESSEFLGEGIKNAFHGAFEAMMQGENVFKALGQMLLDLIKKLIAAALAAFVLSTLIGGIFGKGANFAGPEGLKGLTDMKGLFGSFLGIGTSAKEMASGGIVSTPTLAEIGEYAGARQNPEVVAPLDKLKNLIGDTAATNVQVGGQFTLKGQDLVVALQRADRNRNRIK